MLRSHSPRGRALVLGAALLSLAAICPAQETRGSITGKITDSQNALIPGAPVTVTNVLTGVSNKVATNQTGYYEVDFLDPERTPFRRRRRDSRPPCGPGLW